MLSFLEIDTDTLAEQITLLEYSLLKNVRNSEFIKQAWNRENKEINAPNILKYIDWFNKVSTPEIPSTHFLKKN